MKKSLPLFVVALTTLCALITTIATLILNPDSTIGLISVIIVSIGSVITWIAAIIDIIQRKKGNDQKNKNE